jgi:hypothetical protein
VASIRVLRMRGAQLESIWWRREKAPRMRRGWAGRRRRAIKDEVGAEEGELWKRSGRQRESAACRRNCGSERATVRRSGASGEVRSDEVGSSTEEREDGTTGLSKTRREARRSGTREAGSVRRERMRGKRGLTTGRDDGAVEDVGRPSGGGRAGAARRRRSVRETSTTRKAERTRKKSDAGTDERRGCEREEEGEAGSGVSEGESVEGAGAMAEWSVGT